MHTHTIVHISSVYYVCENYYPAASSWHMAFGTLTEEELEERRSQLHAFMQQILRKPMPASLQVGRSVGKSFVRSVGRSVSRSVGRSVSRSVGKSFGKSVGRLIDR